MGFPPGTAGALPAGGANGGYVGLQQGPVQANPGQNPYGLQQGQWSLNQVTQEALVL